MTVGVLPMLTCIYTQQLAHKLMFRLNSSDASLMDTVLLTNQLAVRLAGLC